MSLTMLLTVLTVAIAVTVLGVLSAIAADNWQARARGWVFASLGLAVGVGACATWHSASAGRVAAFVLVLQGWIVFERLRRNSMITEETTSELITERLP